MAGGGSGILAALRGQTITVPDLSKTFDGWPMEINQHYQKMIPVVDEKLQRCVLPFPNRGAANDEVSYPTKQRLRN
jgi:hypothetical protein